MRGDSLFRERPVSSDPRRQRTLVVARDGPSGGIFVRRARTYVYCARLRHKVSIPISLRRVYDTGGLSLCLSYELYERRTGTESERALSTKRPREGWRKEEAVALVKRRNVPRRLPHVAGAHARLIASCEILTRFRLRAAVMARVRDNRFAGSNGMLLCGR